MSKRQRLQGDELLFSQSELAELDAELAPQPEDVASTTSQRSPARVQPASVDELVDTAFSDEETAEKKPALSSDPDLGAGFDGFVEAEPANTEELMAVMAQQEPISSVAAPAPSGRAGGAKLAVGEISGSRRRSQPEMVAALPSVIFDDSPFSAEERKQLDEPGVIAPQLAALAAAIDSRSSGQFAMSETVLSSSPPPSKVSRPRPRPRFFAAAITVSWMVCRPGLLPWLQNNDRGRATLSLSSQTPGPATPVRPELLVDEPTGRWELETGGDPSARGGPGGDECRRLLPAHRVDRFGRSGY